MRPRDGKKRTQWKSRLTMTDANTVPSWTGLDGWRKRVFLKYIPCICHTTPYTKLCYGLFDRFRGVWHGLERMGGGGFGLLL